MVFATPSEPGKSSPDCVPLTPTVTVADFTAVPPAPVQLSVKVFVEALSVPVVALPPVALLPVQAPLAGEALAVQPVAFVVLHVNVEAAPLATAAGLALRESVGAGVGGGGEGGGGGVAVTVIVTDLETLPPLPEQLSENMLVAVRAPVETLVPETCLLPLHELLAGEALAVQFVAFEVVHVSADVPPLTTDTGVALNDSVGSSCAGGDATVATVAGATDVSPPHAASTSDANNRTTGPTIWRVNRPCAEIGNMKTGLFRLRIRPARAAARLPTLTWPASAEPLRALLPLKRVICRIYTVSRSAPVIRGPMVAGAAMHLGVAADRRRA